jgi:hypothetical protein
MSLMLYFNFSQVLEHSFEYVFRLYIQLRPKICWFTIFGSGSIPFLTRISHDHCRELVHFHGKLSLKQSTFLSLLISIRLAGNFKSLNLNPFKSEQSVNNHGNGCPWRSWWTAW